MSNNLRYRVMRGRDYDDVPDNELTYKALMTGLRERSSSHGFPQIHHAPGEPDTLEDSNIIHQVSQTRLEIATTCSK